MHIPAARLTMQVVRDAPLARLVFYEDRDHLIAALLVELRASAREEKRVRAFVLLGRDPYAERKVGHTQFASIGGRETSHICVLDEQLIITVDPASGVPFTHLQEHLGAVVVSEGGARLVVGAPRVIGADSWSALVDIATGREVEQSERLSNLDAVAFTRWTMALTSGSGESSREVVVASSGEPREAR